MQIFIIQNYNIIEAFIFFEDTKNLFDNFNINKMRLNNQVLIANKRLINNLIMQNKIDQRLQLIDRNKVKSLQRIYESAESTSHPSIHRIFELPSFMYASKDQQRQSDRKITYGTLNGFQPKLEQKNHRQLSSGKRFRVKQGFQRTSRAKKILEQHRTVEQHLNKMIQKQLNHFREQNRVFINPNAQQLKKEILGTQFTNKSIESQKQLSPYAKYSVNAFPKKQPKGLIKKNNSFNPGKDELGTKFKNTLREKIEEIQSKFNEMHPKNSNILEVMTIYSIKQKPAPSNTFFKKKQRYNFNQNREKNIHYNQARIKEKNINDVEEIKRDLIYQKIYHKKIYSYMTFLNKVNFSNKIPIRNFDLSEKFNNNKIKVYVGNGNNKYLLIALLKRRFWLEITNKITPDTKFIWTQNSIKEVHSSQKSFNQHLVNLAQKESIQEQAKNAKDNLFKIKINTMKKLNPENDESIVERSTKFSSINLHQSSIASQDTPLCPQIPSKSLIKLKLKKRLFRQCNNKLFINPEKGIEAESLLKSFKINIKKELQNINLEDIPTITNHVPHNSFIGSKKALFYTMEHYYRNIKKIDPFTIIPKTYHFKTPNDESYTEFLQNQKQSLEKSIWIVKPGECTNRGNGIFIVRAAQVTRKLLKKQVHQNGQLKTTIVQSYITDPLLYNGRKFDIRHYMMVSIINGNLKAYWYSEGYIRTSSQLFTLQDLNNKYIHLTNDAIQKYSDKYGKFEPGNKLSYNELQRYFDNNFIKQKVNFREQILSKMKQIATDVIKANYKSIDKDRKVNNFELFGMDFMIDRKFKPWLIEINANPCLQISCPLHSRIIPIMVEHTLRLGLDPLILPTSHYPPNQRYYLSDNFIQNLRYQIIFDELEHQEDNSSLFPLTYNFDFDEPEDEYQNQGAEIDLGKLLD